MKRHHRLLAVLLFVALIVVIVQLTGLREHLNRDYVVRLLLDHQALGLLLFVLLFTLGNVILIPGWVFLAAAVLALGPLWGGLATYLAALVSCGVTFVLIRLLGGDALRRLEGKWALRLFAQLDRFPIRSVALLRTLFQTSPPLNYALAMSGVPLRHYLVGSVLGLPLPIAVYCVFVDLIGHAAKLV